MARRERQLRAKLNLTQGLIERVAAQTREEHASGAKARIDSKPTLRGRKTPAPSDKGRVPQVPILRPGKPRTQPRRGQKP
jgi:hypothetical protein